MAFTDHVPGEPAPRAGVYEELNVFGTPTGRLAVVAKDEEFPDAAAAAILPFLAEGA